MHTANWPGKDRSLTYMLVTFWLKSQELHLCSYSLRNVHTGYVLYRALVVNFMIKIQYVTLSQFTCLFGSPYGMWQKVERVVLTATASYSTIELATCVNKFCCSSLMLLSEIHSRGGKCIAASLKLGGNTNPRGLPPP